MVNEDKADHREMQMAALRYDISTARPLRELIAHEIELGTDLKYIAIKYGHFKNVTLEGIQRLKAKLDGEKEARDRDREARNER